jgi:hypothetical protein
VREHVGANWFTPQGVHAKLKLLEAKGLPDFGGWRFITLSCDPKFFGGDPLLAYLAGREHMRRFMDRCREAGLWAADAKWCWKLEFQKNGWAHWHLLVDRKKKFTHAEFRKIEDVWGFGRTNVRRIAKSKKFGYLFKYVFKGVYQEGDDSGFSVPAWFLDHFEPSKGGEKPKSFARVRFWQTCKDFYTGLSKVYETGEPQSSIVPRPVRAVVEDRAVSFVVVARDAAGTYEKSSLVRLGMPRREFVRSHVWDVDNGAALVLSASSFIMAPGTLCRALTERDKWQISKTLEVNRLTLEKANQIRHSRKDLRTF